MTILPSARSSASQASWITAHRIVANKFAYRATDMQELRTAKDPIGPENDRHIEQVLRGSDLHVVAWGAYSASFPRPLALSLEGHRADSHDRVSVKLHCIGTNDDKHPKHPVMTRYATPMTVWQVPWIANPGGGRRSL